MSFGKLKVFSPFLLNIFSFCFSVSSTAVAEGAELLLLPDWSKQQGKSRLAQGGAAVTQVVVLPSAGVLLSDLGVEAVQESRFAGLLVGTEEHSFSSTGKPLNAAVEEASTSGLSHDL